MQVQQRSMQTLTLQYLTGRALGWTQNQDDEVEPLWTPKRCWAVADVAGRVLAYSGSCARHETYKIPFANGWFIATTKANGESCFRKVLLSATIHTFPEEGRRDDFPRPRSFLKWEMSPPSSVPLPLYVEEPLTEQAKLMLTTAPKASCARPVIGAKRAGTELIRETSSSASAPPFNIDRGEPVDEIMMCRDDDGTRLCPLYCQQGESCPDWDFRFTDRDVVTPEKARLGVCRKVHGHSEHEGHNCPYCEGSAQVERATVDRDHAPPPALLIPAPPTWAPPLPLGAAVRQPPQAPRPVEGSSSAAAALIPTAPTARPDIATLGSNAAGAPRGGWFTKCQSLATAVLLDTYTREELRAYAHDVYAGPQTFAP